MCQSPEIASIGEDGKLNLMRMNQEKPYKTIGIVTFHLDCHFNLDGTPQELSSIEVVCGLNFCATVNSS